MDRKWKKAELQKDLISFLGKKVCDLEVQVQGDIDLDSMQSSWHGISPEDLKEEHLEQILWVEINFRYKLQALDIHARRGTSYKNDKNV